MVDLATTTTLCHACGRGHEPLPEIAVEAAAGYFHGRPLDANPIRGRRSPSAGRSWRYGWLGASLYERLRGDRERRRWLREAA